MISSSLAMTVTSSAALCTTTLLPANGVLSVSGRPDMVLTLNEHVVFQAPCPTAPLPTVSIALSSPATSSDGSLDLSGGPGSSDSNDSINGDDEDGSDESPHFSDFRDPFFASSFPICYALASTTVTAYMLVIMLFVTPRSFFDSGVVYLGRRVGGFTTRTGASGGVNIGGRPWLQKVAALTVAVSLTIATADTFKIAKEQYIWGVQNAKVLQNEVMGSTELKVIRIISDTFLWLAQAQTLIRLFPRQREKVIIKWAAFALISLDVIFSALNSFIYADPGAAGRTVPKGFTHPVPALGYLFQLSLGVLYAAWVIYYALMKKRYAFYHPLMRNMCLVAMMSLTAIVIPVVFFILDISKPQFTGWGDYVRWVGAAAASVVVWEWVERIEALEREEKKDGILGREVFDGDDNLEVNASEVPWSRRRKRRKRGDGTGSATAVVVEAEEEEEEEEEEGEGQEEERRMSSWSGVRIIGNRRRSDGDGEQRNRHRKQQGDERRDRGMGNLLRPAIWLTRPALSVPPISRTDTTSAESTVYAVRYQGAGGSDAGMARSPDSPIQLQNMSAFARGPSQGLPDSNADAHDVEANTAEPRRRDWRTLMQAATNPLSGLWTARSQAAQTESRGRWDLRARLEEFAATQAERLRERLRPVVNTDSLPVTVIPAPARRGAALQQVLEEEELAGSAVPDSRRGSGGAAARPAQTHPPLWPGVGNRTAEEEEEDDDAYSYDSTESLSVVYREGDEDGPRDEE